MKLDDNYHKADLSLWDTTAAVFRTQYDSVENETKVKYVSDVMS